MKRSLDGLTALRSSVRQLFEPGSLAMCHSTNQSRPSSCRSRQDYSQHRWHYLKDFTQHPCFAESGLVTRDFKHGSAHHTLPNTRNGGHLQIRAIQIYAALAQGSTGSREAQSSPDRSRTDDSGSPQPANSAPAGMLGCHEPGYMSALYTVSSCPHHTLLCLLDIAHTTLLLPHRVLAHAVILRSVSS